MSQEKAGISGLAIFIGAIIVVLIVMWIIGAKIL